MDIITYALLNGKINKIVDAEGLAGKSAYEIALEAGFEGTEEEWLESLQGESGIYVGADQPEQDFDVWINPEGDDYEILPIATDKILGGVMPEAKTEEMTQPVGIDEFGKLFTASGAAYEEVVLLDVTLEEETNKIQSKIFNPNPFKDEDYDDVEVYFYAKMKPSPNAAARGKLTFAWLHNNYGYKGVEWHIGSSSYLNQLVVPSSACAFPYQVVSSTVKYSKSHLTSDEVQTYDKNRYLVTALLAYVASDAYSWIDKTALATNRMAGGEIGNMIVASTDSIFGVGSQFKVIARFYKK